MSERIVTITAFAGGLVVTVGLGLLFTAWNFEPVDLVLLVLFGLGVSLGVWATRVWYGIGVQHWGTCITE